MQDERRNGLRIIIQGRIPTGLELVKNLQMRAHVFEAFDEPSLIDVQQFLKLVSVYHTSLDGLQVDGAMCAHFLHGSI